jgi:hypothetical protein
LWTSLHTLHGTNAPDYVERLDHMLQNAIAGVDTTPGVSRVGSSGGGYIRTAAAPQW